MRVGKNFCLGQRMTLRTILISLVCGPLTLFAEPTPGTAKVRVAAEKFLTTLEPDQRKLATFTLDDDERENWHYVPMDRAGIRLDALNEAQKAAAHALLANSLSAQGHATAQEVIQLETMLYEKSNQSEFRNPGKYTVAIFGSPSAKTPWGWRFEGHHLSLNFSILDEKVALTTPFFFGTNPAEIREGKRKGLRPLGTVEDAARALARKLHTEGLHVRFTNKPPEEILTGQDRVAKKPAVEGVAFSELEEGHQQEFLALVQLVAASQNEKFLKVTREDLAEASFGWAGEFDKGVAHYFRVQTPQFLIEYANTQNNANHAHLVWRDFDGDFGRDVLREHLLHDH